MTQDEQHLDMLAIFHYVVGGITACFSCIFLHNGAVVTAPPTEQYVRWLVSQGCFLLSHLGRCESMPANNGPITSVEHGDGFLTLMQAK
jgi:hypothetical protein